MAVHTSSWSGAAGNGLWFDAANWSAGVPREIAVDARFAGGAFGTVSLAESGRRMARAGLLTLTRASVTFAHGSLQLFPSGNPPQAQDLSVTDASLTVASDATIQGPGIFDFYARAHVQVAGQLDDLNASVLGAQTHVTVSGTGARWGTTGTLYLGTPGGSARIDVVQGGSLSAGYAVVADGEAVVGGPGSVLNAGTLQIGNGPDGALVIRDGATVTSGDGIVGDGPLATVVLTGPGSVWTTQSLLIGDGPENASVTVTAGATLDAPFGGVSVDGTLVLDGTAHLLQPGGAIDAISNGTILAEPPPGAPSGPDVVIGAGIYLFGGAGPDAAHLASLPGTRLVMTGAFQEAAVLPENVQIDGGTVVLANAHNQIDQVQINQGVLDLAATGAAGGRNIAFLGSSGTLRIEDGVSLHATITGLQTSGLFLDLAGFGTGTGAAYTGDAAGGGTLAVTDGTKSLSLVLTDYHASNGFIVRSDGSGGSVIYYQGPTHA